MKPPLAGETIYQVLDRIETEPELDVGADGSSLDLLQAVYRDSQQPISRRMRAAIAALPFEHPKLSVVAALGPNDGFAAKLEDAIKRTAELRSRGLVIDGTAEQVEQARFSNPSRD
jgi:hypothetical protein